MREVAGEVVECVRDCLRGSEVKRIDRRHTTVADCSAAIAQRGTALNLNVGPPRRIAGVGVEGDHARLLAADPGAPFHDQLKAGAVVTEEDWRAIDGPQRSCGSAVCAG